MTFKNSKSPEWEIPENLEEIIAEEESWESEAWLPILLTVMGGTIYRGREIRLAWQIEFEPGSEEFEIPNEKISEIGFEPDGYGWANAIHPSLTRITLKSLASFISATQKNQPA